MMGDKVIMNEHIEEIINNFMSLVLNGEIEIYNEFSLQHEIGIYLRERLGDNYKVQFERNISYFGISGTQKKEIDIVIFNEQEKYAIEIKCPRNGQIPEQMYQMCKDIRFMEELKAKGFTNGYSLNYINIKPFLIGNRQGSIYQKFRNEKMIYGEIVKPTGAKDETLCFKGNYKINWIGEGIEKYFLISV